MELADVWPDVAPETVIVYELAEYGSEMVTYKSATTDEPAVAILPETTVAVAVQVNEDEVDVVVVVDGLFEQATTPRLKRTKTAIRDDRMKHLSLQQTDKKPRAPI